MATDSIRYGLRARQVTSKRSSVVQSLDSEALQPAAAATVAAGLRIGGLSKAELVQFRARSSQYLEARYLQPQLARRTHLSTSDTGSDLH